MPVSIPSPVSPAKDGIAAYPIVGKSALPRRDPKPPTAKPSRPPDLGVDPATAEQVISQTLYGAAATLHRTSVGPTDLTAQVATPGGVTRAGLDELDHALLTDTLHTALRSAITHQRQAAPASTLVP
ncbi:pyrroline-5-carboxylate reductase family protein [Nocardia sp. NPDC052316]|uniref:pyrroline-5-carboxylate reductase family protein n=1 Tax=Nocardia sp. NPDC052316 TaxID=3364329 RepID=UPI0037C8D2FA